MVELGEIIGYAWAWKRGKCYCCDDIELNWFLTPCPAPASGCCPDDASTDRYAALAASGGMTIRYVLDTHTHADHFSAARDLRDRLDAPCIMHRSSPAPFVDIHAEDGETIIVGELRLSLLHTPGHTSDSMCVALPDRVLTGDTLLLGATGRTDLPTGDADALYDSLFQQLLRLDGSLLVCPAHNYKNHDPTSLDEQKKTNARL